MVVVERQETAVCLTCQQAHQPIDCQTAGIEQAALPLGKKVVWHLWISYRSAMCLCRGVGESVGMRLTRCIPANPRHSAPAWEESLGGRRSGHGRGWRRFDHSFRAIAMDMKRSGNKISYHASLRVISAARRG